MHTKDLQKPKVGRVVRMVEVTRGAQGLLLLQSLLCNHSMPNVISHPYICYRRVSKVYDSLEARRMAFSA